MHKARNIILLSWPRKTIIGQNPNSLKLGKYSNKLPKRLGAAPAKSCRNVRNDLRAALEINYRVAGSRIRTMDVVRTLFLMGLFTNIPF